MFSRPSIHDTPLQTTRLCDDPGFDICFAVRRHSRRGMAPPRFLLARTNNSRRAGAARSGERTGAGTRAGPVGNGFASFESLCLHSQCHYIPGGLFLYRDFHSRRDQCLGGAIITDGARRQSPADACNLCQPLTEFAMQTKNATVGQKIGVIRSWGKLPKAPWVSCTKAAIAIRENSSPSRYRTPPSSKNLWRLNGADKSIAPFTY